MVEVVGVEIVPIYHVAPFLPAAPALPSVPSSPFGPVILIPESVHVSLPVEESIAVNV